MVCPNYDKYLDNDEQLLIIPNYHNNRYLVDHVTIYSEGSTEIKIKKHCDSKFYRTLTFGE